MNNMQLPKDWEIKKFCEIGEIVSGGTPSTKVKDYFNGDIPWITPSDLTDYANIFISRGKRNISEEGLRHSSAKRIPSGSILFTSRAPIGYVVISKNEITTNQGFKSLVPQNGIFNKYVYYYLKSAKKLAENLASGTTFLELSGKKFGQIPIPLPPIPEQHRIVAKIEELFEGLDKGMESLKKAKEQIKVYRQAVLEAAFEGNLTNEKINEKELPKNWKLVLLEDIAAAIDPQPSHRTPPKVESGIPYIGIGEFDKVTGKINFQKARKVSKQVLNEHIQRYQIEDSDFIIGKIGTIGKPYKIPTKRFYTLSANIVLVKLNINKINPDYLFYLIKSTIIEKQFLKGSLATTQAAFGIKKVRKLELPLPNKEKQKQIVYEIEKRLSEANILENQIDLSLQQAEALRQSILKKAFEGKLVPQIEKEN